MEVEMYHRSYTELILYGAEPYNYVLYARREGLWQEGLKKVEMYHRFYTEMHHTILCYTYETCLPSRLDRCWLAALTHGGASGDGRAEQSGQGERARRDAHLLQPYEVCSRILLYDDTTTILLPYYYYTSTILHSRPLSTLCRVGHFAREDLPDAGDTTRLRLYYYRTTTILLLYCTPEPPPSSAWATLLEKTSLRPETAALALELAIGAAAPRGFFSTSKFCGPVRAPLHDGSITLHSGLITVI